MAWRTECLCFDFTAGPVPPQRRGRAPSPLRASSSPASHRLTLTAPCASTCRTAALLSLCGNHPFYLHAIDGKPARRRGVVVHRRSFQPTRAASSARNDLLKNCGMTD